MVPLFQQRILIKHAAKRQSFLLSCQKALSDNYSAFGPLNNPQLCRSERQAQFCQPEGLTSIDPQYAPHALRAAARCFFLTSIRRRTHAIAVWQRFKSLCGCVLPVSCESFRPPENHDGHIFVCSILCLYRVLHCAGNIVYMPCKDYICAEMKVCRQLSICCLPGIPFGKCRIRCIRRLCHNFCPPLTYHWLLHARINAKANDSRRK